MGQQQFELIIWIVFICICVVLVVWSMIWSTKRYKREMAKKKETDLRKDAASAAPEFTTVSIKATVIDQICCVKTVGIKTPKTIKEFSVVFQTENGETLKWNVPEEMYDGFEKGQSGTLSVVDGELYGFELSGTDSSDP